MGKINKDFFEGGVLVCGCSSKDNLYYKRLYKAFTDNGIKVYPMPTTPESELGFTTYAKFNDLPEIPKSVYILSHKSLTPQIMEHLYELGVKKIAFYSMACVDSDILQTCQSKGIETTIGCPLMLFASGFCWIHAAIAGVKQEKRRRV